jgi:hypothetical protein
MLGNRTEAQNADEGLESGSVHGAGDTETTAQGGLSPEGGMIPRREKNMSSTHQGC